MSLPNITFVVNGAKPRTQRTIAAIERTFGAYPLTIVLTEYSGHAIPLAAKAVQAGAQIMVSVGGDGTLNEVVNGIIQGTEAGRAAIDSPALAILPMGSGNDFVKNFGPPPQLEGLRQAIEQQQAQWVDVGVAEFVGPNHQPTKRYFINISDIGIGGLIAQKLSRYYSWLGPGFTYQRAIISTLLTYSPQMLSVSTPTQQLTTPMMSLVIANGKYFGSGLGIAPDALLNDGLLEVVMLKNITILDYLRQLPKVRRCQVLQHPEVSYSRAAHISVSSDQPLPLDMDGEFVGFSPVTFSILPQRIKIIG